MTFQVTSIPNANDDPSDSQLEIKNNFTSQIGWAQVDHIGYGATNSGNHNQVTIVDPTSPVPGTPTDKRSIAYTKLGIADITSSNLFVKNKNVDVQVNAIRAWAFVKGIDVIVAPANVPITQFVNVTTVDKTGPGSYLITMPANTVSSADYAVLVSAQKSAGVFPVVNTDSYTATTFTVELSGNPKSFSFQVMQV